MIDPTFEDDIPIPEPLNKGSTGMFGPHRTVIRKMEVGQSFIAYGLKEYARFGSGIEREHKEGPKRFVRRKVGEGQWRIWRTK